MVIELEQSDSQHERTLTILTLPDCLEYSRACAHNLKEQVSKRDFHSIRNGNPIYIGVKPERNN